MAAIAKIRKITETEIRIQDALLADGGAKFRELQGKWFTRLKDAFNPEEEKGNRSHFGFSGAGNECARALWFDWRWMSISEFEAAKSSDDPEERAKVARSIRLLNRGHLEEARFMALLEMIGIQVEDPGENGQARLSAVEGHAGSALDAVMTNCPDVPGQRILGEFKTSNDAGFKKVAKDGCRIAKPEHYVQMQLCMKATGFTHTLYMVVNKNNDDIYVEIIPYDEKAANAALERMRTIIHAPSAPRGISSDPSWFKCGWCKSSALCHEKKHEYPQTCRSCVASAPSLTDKTWTCMVAGNATIPDHVMKTGCPKYQTIFVA